MLKKGSPVALGLFLATVVAATSDAAVLRVQESDFLASAGLITFSEFPLGTTNPVFTPADYGGGAGSPTVSTGGFFVGQSLSANPGVDCPGAAASACVVGSPSDALALDPGSPNTFIAEDGATPTSPVLSGSPLFNGPIALLFSEDQYGVGFGAGYFDAVGSTGITAVARDGTILGTVTNSGFGVEFLGLVTDDGTASIAGVYLNLVGSEPAGFVIDNLRFGQRGDVTPPTAAIPLPATALLLMGALGSLGLAGMRRTRT